MKMTAKLNSQQKVSTVILSFNHPELTERCVNSALQHFAAEDILLVHNGSEKKWIQKHQEAFPQIHHLILQHNKGFTGGSNAGLRLSFEKYDWILFLTNDCLLLKAPNSPVVPGLYAPMIWARKMGRVDSVGGVLDLAKAHLRHLKEPDYTVQGKECFYVPGTAFWIHRDIFSTTLGFDESLGTYWEDVDLSMRVAELGLPIGVESKTEVLHGIGKTCHGNSHYTTYLFQRNRRRICLQLAQNQPWLKTQIIFHLYLSWFSLAIKKLRRGQWQDLKRLYAAIRDVSAHPTHVQAPGKLRPEVQTR
jgi:GT2 family glycosyltransferase